MRFHPIFLAGILILPVSPALVAAQTDGTAATAPTTRSMADITRDMDQTSQELRSIAGSPKDILDPAKRKEIGPKALPLLNKMEGLMKELGQANPALAPQINTRRYQLLSMKALLGDPGAETALKEASNSPDAKTANSAKTAMLVVEWVRTAQDAGAQSKVLDRTEELAKANPEDMNVTLLLVSYAQFGAASPENRQRALKMINEDLKGPLADQIRLQIAKAATRPATR